MAEATRMRRRQRNPPPQVFTPTSHTKGGTCVYVHCTILKILLHHFVTIFSNSFDEQNTKNGQGEVKI